MESQVIKPVVKLVGQDSNIYNLINLATKALQKAGQNAQAKEMTKKCFSADDYDYALCIIMEYCDVN